jgi:16S rRNA (cytosine967-C5)-methyltransferase
MSVSPARQMAYHILRRVESGRGFAVDWLQSRGVFQLKEADRRLATELVMGVLRWRGELDFQIERLSGKSVERYDPEVVTVLRLGIYQIRFLERIPKAAAVNEAVEMIKAARKRSAAGLVNAVLRKCRPPAQRLTAEKFDELDPSGVAGVRRAVPGWLFERWAAREKSRDLKPGGAVALAWASTRVPPATLRVIGARVDREEVQRALSREGVVARPGRFASGALVVESGSVQASTAFREGRVVMQDEASQLVVELLAPQCGQRVLDLCAAPGIKTGQLAQVLGSGSLVACDVSAPRLRTMVKLLPRMVPAEVRIHIVRADATRALPFGITFDRILLDAPCSGTGTLSRNPEIKWRLKPSDFARLAAVQTAMLRNALALLAPGGRLVYATCSLEPEENEEVAELVLRETPDCRLLAASELSREFPALASLFDARGYFRTRPDVHPMDGFFAAVIAKER